MGSCNDGEHPTATSCTAALAILAPSARAPVLRPRAGTSARRPRASRAAPRGPAALAGSPLPPSRTPCSATGHRLPRAPRHALWRPPAAAPAEPWPERAVGPHAAPPVASHAAQRAQPPGWAGSAALGFGGGSGRVTSPRARQPRARVVSADETAEGGRASCAEVAALVTHLQLIASASRQPPPSPRHGPLTATSVHATPTPPPTAQGNGGRVLDRRAYTCEARAQIGAQVGVLRGAHYEG